MWFGIGWSAVRGKVPSADVYVAISIAVNVG